MMIMSRTQRTKSKMSNSCCRKWLTARGEKRSVRETYCEEQRESAQLGLFPYKWGWKFSARYCVMPSPIVIKQHSVLKQFR